MFTQMEEKVKRKKKRVCKSYMTHMHARTQMRGDPESSDKRACSRRWGRNKTETDCSLDIHDNNKLIEFTAHILFILFDRVLGDLHGRETLERIQNISDGWMKGGIPSKARWTYVFICHI